MKTKIFLLFISLCGMSDFTFGQGDSIFYSFGVPNENTLSYCNLGSKFKEGKWLLTNKSDNDTRSVIAMDEHFKRKEKVSLEVRALMEVEELTRNSKYGFDMNMITKGSLEGDLSADGYVVRFLVQKAEHRFFINEYYVDYSKDGKINDEVKSGSVRPDGELNYMATDLTVIEKTDKFKDSGSDLIGMERLDGKIIFYINGSEVYNIPDREAGSFIRSVYIDLAPKEKLKVDNLAFIFNKPA